MKNSDSISIPENDWFTKAFLCDFLGKASKAKQQLNVKEYRLSAENTSPRVINHWVELGLVTDDRPGGKGWWMFSISEMMWLGIIYKLRNFGMELNKILKVKEYLRMHNSEDPQSKFPVLDFYILHAVNTTHPVKLIVFQTGQAILARQIDIDRAKQSGDIHDDFISIDIGKIVKNEYRKQILKTDYVQYAFTDIEKEVHSSIFLEEVHSITIKVAGGKEFLIRKEHMAGSKQEFDSLIKKAGRYFEEVTVHNGNKKVHKIIEKKKVKRK